MNLIEISLLGTFHQILELILAICGICKTLAAAPHTKLHYVGRAMRHFGNYIKKYLASTVSRIFFFANGISAFIHSSSSVSTSVSVKICSVSKACTMNTGVSRIHPGWYINPHSFTSRVAGQSTDMLLSGNQRTWRKCSLQTETELRITAGTLEL